MGETVSWWLALQVLALFSLVLALSLFRSLPDRGYGLGKALGLLLPAYALWLLAWTGVLPNSRSTVFLVVLLAGGVSAYGAFRWRLFRPLAGFLRENWRMVVATEAVFAISFFGAALLRAYHPDIAGTEQPMDFAFLNSSLRSVYLPPNDPWYSGQPISYYYFGYLIQTLPIRITGIPSSIGYNLALASIFAMTVTGAFSLGYNLVASRSFKAAVLVGLLAAMLVAVAGNLEGALEFLRAWGLGTPAFWQWIGINGALTPSASPAPLPTDFFWWWRATRVINTLRITTGPDGGVLSVDDHADYTITEFPSFSFILGDMHPHVMALPFVLMALGLALNFARRGQALGLDWVRKEPLAFGGAALVLGAIGFINSWDRPVYLGLALGGVLLGAARSGRIGWTVWGAMAALALACVFLYFPYYLGPKPPLQGLGLVGAYGTSPVHFFIVWGAFLFALCGFLAARLPAAARVAKERPQVALLCLAIALAPLALWALGQALLQRIAGLPGVSGPAATSKELSVAPLVLVVAFLLLLVLSPRLRGGAEESFVLLLCLAGFALTAGAELFFLRDAFGNRMNTIFKFYYQAWVLFAVASAYGIYWVSAKLRASRGRLWLGGVWGVGLALLVLSALSYPLAASYSRMDMLKQEPSLDGLAFLNAPDPAGYEAIKWLNSNVEGGPVVIEAPGNSYSDYGRVSSATGLPTVIQWPGHETQWRGPVKDLGQRELDVNLIYSSVDRTAVQGLLDKYGVRYIYVGRLEISKYGEGIRDKFAGMMDLAFQNTGVSIFRVRS
ncbi:MAG: DUF2298 domain-containing protein [Dehalococcoidia bacterium]|nr:DUF2298 domain-containing protein [Dehalococcoidia bacterium]